MKRGAWHGMAYGRAVRLHWAAALRAVAHVVLSQVGCQVFDGDKQPTLDVTPSCAVGRPFAAMREIPRNAT